MFLNTEWVDSSVYDYKFFVYFFPILIVSSSLYRTGKDKVANIQLENQCYEWIDGGVRRTVTSHLSFIVTFAYCCLLSLLSKKHYYSVLMCFFVVVFFALDQGNSVR